MNKLEAAKQILSLAQTFLPAIMPDLSALVGPQLTEAERQELEAHVGDYERWAEEQRSKAAADVEAEG